jgi:ribosomal protein S18 acetylase RimI-like enzyme
MQPHDPSAQTSATLTVALEPATGGDVPRVLEWMRELYAHERIPFEELTLETTLRELLGNPAYGRAFLLYADGRAVGYALVGLGFSVEHGGRVALLDELFVQPATRGRGIGSIVLRLLQSACRKLGARTLLLEVHGENTRAEALYRREGFASNGRHLMVRKL